MEEFGNEVEEFRNEVEEFRRGPAIKYNGACLQQLASWCLVLFYDYNPQSWVSDLVCSQGPEDLGREMGRASGRRK